MGVNPDLIVALLGGEGVASVIAAVSAFRAHTNSKQFQRNHGSSVADAVDRTELALGKVDARLQRMEAVQESQGHELSAVNARLKHLESSTATAREEILEERKARRRDVAALEDDIEQARSNKAHE